MRRLSPWGDVRELHVRRVHILVHTGCRIICFWAARAGYCCSVQLPVRLPVVHRVFLGLCGGIRDS